MNLKKHTFILFFLLTLPFLLLACSSEDSKDSEEQIELKFAGTYAPDHIITKSMDAIAEEVLDATEDRVKITVYPADQLGGYTSVLEEVMEGTIEMASIPMLSDHTPKFELLYLPFIAKNYEEAETVLSPGSELFTILDKASEEKNLKLVGFHADGFTGIGSAEEISDPLSYDDKDTLLRIAQLDSYDKVSKKLGYSPMSIQYEDIYTSLQTGIIDATMGQSPTTMFTAFSDVISYYYKYNDTFDVAGLIINQDVWNEFNDEDRDAIESIIKDHISTSYTEAEKEEQKSIEKLKDADIEVVEFSEDELKKLSEDIKEDVWNELKGTTFEEEDIEKIKNDTN